MQHFYYNGAPHTDHAGNVRTTYDTSGSYLQDSFFPRGIFFPQPCLTSKFFSWPGYSGGDPEWNGTYQLFVNVGTSGQFFPPAPDRVLLFEPDPLSPIVTTSATVSKLPAGTSLYYTVFPNPWAHFFFQPPLAQGQFQLTCPSGDPDDPNVVATLANNGFNLGLVKDTSHPQPFIDLKTTAGIANFQFVIDARQSFISEFPDNLFYAQGYGQSPDIYGWQTEDEPVLLANGPINPQNGCKYSAMATALDRITTKYNDHRSDTTQVIYHVEGAPAYFLENHGCDPGSIWEDSVRIGDVANHDYYIDLSGAPLSSVRPIADTVKRQTNAVQQLDPSWFTTQAFSSFDNTGCRNEGETRASVYTAIVHGATGIWYFAWDSFVVHAGIRPQGDIPVSYPEGGDVATQFSIGTCEDQWDDIADVNSELAALEYAILAPTSTLKYRVSVSNAGQLNGPPPAAPTSPVHTMLKSVAGDAQYLLAVNMNNTSSTFKFEPLGMQMNTGQTTTWVYPGGNQPQIETSNYIQDTLGPFETKVYRIVYNLQASPDIDGDGCPDANELQTAVGSQTSGGRRDPYNRYDYFDPTQNGQNRVNDIVAVVNQYHNDDLPGPIDYDSLTDRTGAPGGDAWDLTAPNGQQRVDDILAAVKQYHHDCS